MLALREPVPENVSDVGARGDTDVLSCVAVLEGSKLSRDYSRFIKVALLGSHGSSPGQLWTPKLSNKQDHIVQLTLAQHYTINISTTEITTPVQAYQFQHV